MKVFVNGFAASPTTQVSSFNHYQPFSPLSIKRMYMKSILLASLCLSILIAPVLSQTIDKSYHPIFEAPTSLFNGILVGEDAMVIQGDIKLLSGAPSGSIIKITKDGIADPSFNSLNGISGMSYDMDVQSDGKIILSGIFVDKDNHLKLLIRINPDGTLDDSFKGRPNEQSDGTTGFGYLTCVKVLSDDKIVVSGSFSSFDQLERTRLVRLNSDGSLDTSFSSALDFEPFRMWVQADNKILVFGNGKLIRLNNDGSIDNSFVTVDFNSTITSVDFQSDNRIIAAGLFTQVNGTSVNKIVRMSTEGSVDTTFVGVPTFSIMDVQKIKVSPDDHIIAIGNLNSHVMRLAANGELDTTFQVGDGITFGHIVPNTNFVAIQTDGAVVVGGIFSSYQSNPCMSLVRINANGDIDASYKPRPAFSSGIEDIEVQLNGKAMVAGRFVFVNGEPAPGGIVRLNADGTTDQTFDVSPILWRDGHVSAVGQYQDGKILLGGNFSASINNGISEYTNSLIRLTENGAIDPSFTGYTGITKQYNSDGVNDLIIQPDGKAIVAGSFLQINGADRKYLARLNADGSVDDMFHPTGTDYAEPILQINMDSTTGKIVLLHNSNVGETPRMVEITKPDGSRDPQFDITGKLDKTYVYSAIYLSDGSLLIGGNFTSYNGNAVSNLVKISEDGTMDETFASDASNTQINSLFKTDTDKILIGRYADFDSTSALRIISDNGTLLPFDINIPGSFTRITSDGGNSFYLAGSFSQLDDSFLSGGLLKLTSDANPAAPIELTADGHEQTMELTWTDTTATVFEIERSMSTNSNFTLHAISNTTGFADDIDLIRDSVYYYRVRAVTLNGNSAFSNEASASLPLITAAQNKTEQALSIYPNPFTKTFVLHNHTASTMEASIMNYSGQEIFRTQVTSHSSADLGGSLPSGLYIVKVKKPGKLSVIKLIKQ
jgi:uncharacterized delta-60 repeat protein